MEVARKDAFQYQPQWEVQQPEQKKKGKNKPQPSYRKEKVVAFLSIASLMALSLVLLLRYATIIQMRHEVHRQQSQIEELEKQVRKQKIELERVSKSRAIEEEALVRLEMQYPTPENTQYISIDQTKVQLLTEALEQRVNAYYAEEVPKTSIFTKMVGKFTALLNI